MLPPSEYVVYEDMRNAEVQVQITTPTDVVEKYDPNQATLNNYWLNEIKSQDDTARQIMTGCAFVISISITLITANISNIESLLKLAMNLSENTYFKVIVPYFIIAIIVFFFALFVQAIINARRTLSLKQIEKGHELIEIAGKKRFWTNAATQQLIFGIWAVIIFFCTFMMIIMKYELVPAMAVSFLLMMSISTITRALRKNTD